MGSILLGNQRSASALQRANAVVAVETDQQQNSGSAGFAEKFDMATMQQIGSKPLVKTKTLSC